MDVGDFLEPKSLYSIMALYQNSRLQSSVTALIIPGPCPALDYGTKYNPSGSQPCLNDTNYGTPFCHNLVRLPPVSPLQRGKRDRKFPPGKWPYTAQPHAVIL